MSVFEAPEFLRMPAVGIDISTDAVRFIELKKHGGQRVVGRYDTIPVTAGIVQAGNVQDAVALSGIIATMARKYHLSMANIALPEEQAFLVQMEFPRVPMRDVRTAVELHLEEYVPIPPIEAVFDYTVVPSLNDETTAVAACVFPGKIVEQYLEVFRGTGITPKSFELQSHAMARAIFPNTNKGTYMGIDIGKDITNIFIMSDGVVEFSAILDMGGDHLSHEISRRMSISFEEADSLKTQFGLIGSSEHGNIRDAMLPVLNDLRERILRYFAFWQTKHSGLAAIERVYITGGGANLRGIAEYLGQGIRATMQVANPWANTLSFDQYTPPIPMHLAHGFTAAIGLALRDVQS